jgi:hypothetical protein
MVSIVSSSFVLYLYSYRIKTVSQYFLSYTIAARLPIELNCWRQCAEPFEKGDDHRLSLYFIPADQHGNEQDRHHQVLGEGGIDRASISFDPPQSIELIKL